MSALDTGSNHLYEPWRIQEKAQTFARSAEGYLHDHEIPELFDKFLEDLIVVQPEDPIAFIMEFIKRTVLAVFIILK